MLLKPGTYLNYVDQKIVLKSYHNSNYLKGDDGYFYEVNSGKCYFWFEKYERFDMSTDPMFDINIELAVALEVISGAYTYKGQNYYVQRIVKLKHPVNRRWIDAIEYCTEDEREYYVREKKEFMQRFTKGSV